MKDFNIVTYYQSLNYGAVLQAFGLQEFLRAQGWEADIFDFYPPASGKVPGIKGKILQLLTRPYGKELALRRSRFQEFRENRLRLSRDMDCRVFLAGSDQVWSTAGSMNPMLFLQYTDRDCLKASYAASMGNPVVAPEKQALFERYIKGFDAVSVRETNARDLISRFYPGPVRVHMDPAALHPREFWQCWESPMEGLPEQFILAYFLHPAKNINRLLRWLKKRTGTPVVLLDSQGYLNWMIRHDLVIRSAGPAEFLWLIDHAAQVVTNSFHGTVFSLLFGKEFYPIVNPASPSRITEFLGRFGIKPIPEEERSFSERAVPDFGQINQILDQEREQSKAYLKELYQKGCTWKRPPWKGSVQQMRDTCTGCGACEAVCPKQAIALRVNSEGFYEPTVDTNKCVNCSRCLQKCPQNKVFGGDRLADWYGWTSDMRARNRSTSGGAMGALAEGILRDNGIVYGAAFSEDWQTVVMTDTDHVPLDALRKSKYTISDPSGVFASVRKQLHAGRRVMFCGTPCQCAGLKTWLGKDEPNLLLCDFICGGVPSLSFYREHFAALEKRYQSKIISVDFRPKGRKWGKFGLEIIFENGKKYLVRPFQDSFLKAFGALHISVRRTCLECRYTKYHAADVTLADFWGWKQARVPFEAAGISLLSAHTDKGLAAIQSMEGFELHRLDRCYADYAFRWKGTNPVLLQERDRFFDRSDTLKSYEKAFSEEYRVGYVNQVLTRVKRLLRK